MAKIGYRENGNELENLYKKTISPSDRFVFSSVRVKKTIFSRTKKKGITMRSLLPEASAAYNNLSSSVKLQWANNYSFFFNNPYKAFVKAYCEMRAHGLTGVPSPNPYYLGKVGKINIASPANRLHIKQAHPDDYYLMKKVKGTKSQYEPVRIFESVNFPLLFKLSYTSELTQVDSNMHARAYIRIYTDYQGRNIVTDEVIEFSLNSSWNIINKIINKPFGTFKGYEMHLDFFGVRGCVYLDHLILLHSGKNWARDPHFNNMKTSYSRKYYQIANHYDIIDLPNGASYDTVYYE